MTADSPPPQGLRVSDLSHRFGDFVAADHIELEVAPGEVHCLLGPSGSGKSTLLRLIAGLEILQQGSISIAGLEVASPGLHRNPEDRAVGFVFQDYALFPHMNVRRNVAFGMTGRTAAGRRRAADRLLERVGMSAFAAAMPHTLSGGQQQRVALARALARKPVVMLLDEPFSGLDARLRGDVRETTLEVLRAAGVATLMVTHDPREALQSADILSVIRAGRIAQTGSPDKVFHHSTSRRVAEVFGPVNRLAAVVRSGHVDSPWGPLAAPGFEDGRGVEMLIRPGSVVLAAHRQVAGPAGEITGLTLAGALVQVEVEVAGRTLEALDLARRGWRVGDRVSVSLADGEVMIRALETD